MKYRNILKAIITAMCCSIVMINFIGCRNYKKENREALEYLNNKYGKEFELEKGRFESVYGDEFYQSPQKETKAWPKDSSNDVFNIEFDSEGNFYDDYQSITMKPYVDEYLTKMAQEYWENAKVKVKIVYKLTDEKYDENHCEQYLEDENIYIYYNIYLKYNDKFDVETESKKVYRICDKLRKMQISNDILITYLDREVTNDEIANKEFWRESDKQGRIIKVFEDSFSKKVPDENKELSIEDIKAELEKDRKDTRNK